MPNKPRRYRVKRHEVVQPLDQSYRLIPLTKGQNAIVDAADYEWLSEFNWYASWMVFHKGYYAATRVGKRIVSMHRMICGEVHEDIDHRNFNNLDNRRDNLRPCTHEQNMHNLRKFTTNTSGFKGVSWGKRERKWRARINLSGKEIHIGTYQSAEDAAQAYDEAANRLYGEFAVLNLPHANAPDIF
jgi:hypothetical protein